MNQFNLYITAHRSTYLSEYKELYRALADEFPEVVLHVLFGEEPSKEAPELPPNFFFVLPRGFSQIVNGALSHVDLLARLRAFVGRVPMDLFRSDIRGVIRTRTPEMLALEQAGLSEAISRHFSEAPPDMVFTSSGTRLIHSVTNHLASSMGVKTYRVHSYLNLNMNLQGQRVWICSNNQMQLSDHAEDYFDYDEAETRDYLRGLLDAIENREYRLDQLSKQFRKRRMPVSPVQIARDILRIGYLKLPFHSRGKVGRLDANASIDRVRILINGLRNRSLTVHPSQLQRPYLLFALNTPYDSQILVRAPEYRDLLSLVELTAGMMPYGLELVVREHPAFLGMLDHDRLRGLQRRHSHVRLVSSDVALPEVIRRAKAVLIINNTALVDAILAGKPVISFANGYFKGTGLTREVGQLQDLRSAFTELMDGKLDVDRHERLLAVQSRLFRETFPGPGIARTDKARMINEAILSRLRTIRRTFGSLDAWCSQRHVKTEEQCDD
jgi:hypothetical protein